MIEGQPGPRYLPDRFGGRKAVPFPGASDQSPEPVAISAGAGQIVLGRDRAGGLPQLLQRRLGLGLLQDHLVAVGSEVIPLVLELGELHLEAVDRLAGWQAGRFKVFEGSGPEGKLGQGPRRLLLRQCKAVRAVSRVPSRSP